MLGKHANPIIVTHLILLVCLLSVSCKHTLGVFISFFVSCSRSEFYLTIIMSLGFTTMQDWNNLPVLLLVSSQPLYVNYLCKDSS